MIRINNTQYCHFLRQADDLRRSGSLCDAIISVKSQTFRAHRLVLACASRALAQQLARPDADRPVHCTLEYFSPRTFQQVLDFTYTQALEVTVDDLRLLLRAAQLLEMHQLEEQCRKQLDTLDDRASEEDARGDIKDVKEERGRAEERTYQEQRGPSVQQDDHTETSLLVKKESVAMKDISESPKSPPSTKKSRLSPVSVLCSRDSVITRPPTSTSSLPSPWTFSANMWDSVSTLRRIAENYSNLFSTYPLQPPNQPPGVNPLSLSAAHVSPLLGSHFQAPVPSYSGFRPRYAPNFYGGSSRMSSIIKQGLLKGNKPHFSGNTQDGERSYAKVAKTSAESDDACRHCDAGSRGGSEPRGSAAAKSGKGCAGCQLCRREDALQHEAESRRGHRGEKPYQCQHCPKKFSLKHQLDTHHRVHTGEKPFECRLCGQRSRDYSAMIKHLRTHGGAAPYQCTLCLEFCSSLVSMQRHIKSHAVQDFPPNWSISSTYMYISHI